MRNLLKELVWEGETNRDALQLAFSKKVQKNRRNWMTNYKFQERLNLNKEKISYTDFINKKFIQFYVLDNERSITSVIDGFKPSQHKIIFCSFKKNLTEDIKISEFAGYVSEHTHYHHGVNNINLLVPDGIFGIRDKMVWVYENDLNNHVLFIGCTSFSAPAVGEASQLANTIFASDTWLHPEVRFYGSTCPSRSRLYRKCVKAAKCKMTWIELPLGGIWRADDLIHAV
ncbi:hypothetical protein GQ457_14G026130 [Hibiscus cannabinus]